MKRNWLFAMAIALPLLLVNCGGQSTGEETQVQALRRAMVEKTEQLMNIHLDLDTAIENISKAEQAAAAGDCAVAGYHAKDAYGSLQEADGALLNLGRDLQALFNLDAGSANRQL